MPRCASDRQASKAVLWGVCGVEAITTVWRIEATVFRTASPWQPLLIGGAVFVVGLIVAVMGFPQGGGGLSGAAVFIASLALAQRADLHVTRGDPPPQFVDPPRTPPLQRGA